MNRMLSVVGRVDRLLPDRYVVVLDLGIQGGGVEAEQPGRTRLVAAGLFERTADQIDLKSFHLVVKIYAAGEVDIVRCAVRCGDHFHSMIRIADLGPQTFDRDLVPGCDDDRPFDDVFKLADIARDNYNFRAVTEPRAKDFPRSLGRFRRHICG